MESKIAKAVGLKYNPVAILLADHKPENGLQFKKGKWGCVMFMFANAAKGKTAAFDAETYGCWGGGVGLGFGNAYLHFPGGVECFSYFLSSGNNHSKKGKEVAKALEGSAGKEFTENVIIPWAAGCQTIGILPFREAKSGKPRAVVGLTDISARKYVRSLLGAEHLSFGAPWEMFLEMEGNVEDSFLKRHTWQSLLESRE